MTNQHSQALTEHLDNTIVTSFPFIRNPSSSNETMSFKALRETYKKGSRGIVISLGKRDFRYACHLIKGIRKVLGSILPIQIAYAGEDDLPKDYREKLMSLGEDIETLDLLSMIDDTTMGLARGGFGIKPMAMLLSSFEQVILVDADSVFLQPPEVLFKSPGYIETGTYFFHDRLLYQGSYQERHAWWRSHLKYDRPSASLLKLASYTKMYSQEQDSGVVLLDKRRTSVLFGLLHICWQNSKGSRNYLYRQVHGDKETYWFGLELCQVPYYFAKHYGNGLGVVTNGSEICGNAILHTDEDDRLLWFNGGLLKNKYQDQKTFGNFTHYMLDGQWKHQNGGDGVSCEEKGEILTVNEEEKKVLSALIREAKIVDQQFQGPITLPKQPMKAKVFDQ